MTKPDLVVLAYHAVEPGPKPLCVDPVEFAGVVQVFAEREYRSITAGQLADHATGGQPMPERAVVFTFDDGYTSVLHHALPILAEHGFVGTVFPVTAHLGATNVWDAETTGVPSMKLMGPEGLAELTAAGWEVGGHTHNHRRLTDLSEREIATELSRSDEIISGLTGTPVGVFAYPYGSHDERVRSVAGPAYRICLTIGAERMTTSTALDRIPRLEGWYVREPGQAKIVTGPFGDVYLAARRAVRSAGRSLRRVLAK